MSSFNKTIPFKSYQGGTGLIGTTVGGLVNANSNPLFKGIWIRNNHATQDLFIGDERVSLTLGFQLPAGEDVFLELEDATAIFILGSAADTAYSWLGY